MRYHEFYYDKIYRVTSYAPWEIIFAKLKNYSKLGMIMKRSEKRSLLNQGCMLKHKYKHKFKDSPWRILEGLTSPYKWPSARDSEIKKTKRPLKRFIQKKKEKKTFLQT